MINDPHKSRCVCPFIHSSVFSSFFANLAFTESVRSKTDILVGNAENGEAVRDGVCSAVELRSANRTGGPQSDAQRGVGSDKTLNVEGKVGGNATLSPEGEIGGEYRVMNRRENKRKAEARRPADAQTGVHKLLLISQVHLFSEGFSSPYNFSLWF
jgi:hypothetical protein